MKISEKIKMFLYMIILSIIALTIIYYMYIYPILLIFNDISFNAKIYFISYLLN